MLIVELTRKDISVGRDWSFLSLKQRHQELLKRGTRYDGIRPPSVFFRTFSSNYDKNGVIYTQQINLLDFSEAMSIEGENLMARVRLAGDGDIAIRCNCPAFLYWGIQYVLTQLGANAAGPEKRFPKVRNPRLKSTVCKHLSVVIDAFPFIMSSVASDLKKQGYE